LNFEMLQAGSTFIYSGDLILMRDAAHKRLLDLFNSGVKLPVDLEGKLVFYAGPAKEREKGKPGAIGPTTSKRMDKYLPFLYSLGVSGTIGKGSRSPEVCTLNREKKKVYLLAPSGAAAAFSKKILKWEILAFEDLGTEAIQMIRIDWFHFIVGIDSRGNSLKGLACGPK